ncbi:hypothetical protein B0F90DRAFT_1079025 [Multifurca ochricompacta]|uniref:Ubiquitin-like domain-containing protein n=1 Tax=Multifurca ochricompacta TaxID=376703 RepID=A0AAD4M8T0_9AGAM|nr:hypothetical protein B0F90DRAFT_1079025 [Multifurca ochricompacta]
MSECPRITYQAPGRTFDRLFKEQSLNETKDVVRKKLGLSYDSPIELAQLRDGKRIDLEDDDDFEAFKTLATSSLHATVTIILPESSRVSPKPARDNNLGLGDGKTRLNALFSEAYSPQATESGAVSPAITSTTSTSRPRKRRKVPFNGNHAQTHPAQQLASSENNIGPASSHMSPPPAVHVSASTAAAPPLSINIDSSARPRSAKSGKPGRRAAKVIPSDDEITVPAESSRKKRQKSGGVPQGSQPFLLNVTSDTKKKHLRNRPAVIPGGATGQDTTSTGFQIVNDLQAQPLVPATADASSNARMEVNDPDIPEQAKAEMHKPETSNAEHNATESKTRLMDPAEAGMFGQSQAKVSKASITEQQLTEF